MVKFGRNKFKALNKIAKKQKADTTNVTNKILKKKQIAEKKVSFQQEVLIKEVLESGQQIVENVSARKVLLDKLSKKPKQKVQPAEVAPEKPQKLKPIEKHKKRQRTQINDAKLLLILMKKKS